MPPSPSLSVFLKMTNHGGKREGAGRPSLKDKKVRITVSLHPRTLKTIRHMGFNNVSLAIDTLAIAYKKHMIDIGAWKVKDVAD